MKKRSCRGDLDGAYEQGIAKLNPWGGLKTFAAILLPLGVFQAQKNRLPAATTLLLIALIILELFSLVPGAGLEPAQPFLATGF